MARVALVFGALAQLPSLSVAGHAYVNFIRHGEKPATGNGLTPDGEHRAEYLARCMGVGESDALPYGRPTMLAAQKVKEGKSHRAVDTLKPLADKSQVAVFSDCEKSDTKCIVDYIQSMPDNTSMVIAWEHKAISGILKALDIPHGGDFQKWPHECDSKAWPEPTSYHGSRCYDKIWHVKFEATSTELGLGAGSGGSSRWTPSSVHAFQEGFGGLASSPCAESLAPAAEVSSLLL